MTSAGAPSAWGVAVARVIAGTAGVLATVCCALPLCWVASVVVASPSAPGGGVLSTFRLELLARTLGIGATVAGLAVVLAVPAARVIGRGRGLPSGAIRGAVFAALFVPTLVLSEGAGRLAVFGEESFPAGITFAPGGLADVLRCVFTLAASLWPIPALLAGLSLRGTDPSVEELAALDGTLARTTLRTMLAPLGLAAAVVFVLAVQQAEIYEPTGIAVVGTEVKMVFSTGAFSGLAPETSFAGQEQRAAAAAATSLPSILASLVFATLLAGPAWRARGGSPSASPPSASRSWSRALVPSNFTLACAAGVLVLTVVAPIAALLATVSSPTVVFDRMLDAPLLDALRGSIMVGGATAAAAFVIALAASAVPPVLLLLPAAASFLLGGQLLAIALLRLSGRPEFDALARSWPLAAIAGVGRFAWVAILPALVTWTGPWRPLRELARQDGASSLGAAPLAVWPLAWPLLAGGAAVAGALTLAEVTATAILAPEPPVLTSFLLGTRHHARSEPLAAAALWTIGAALGTAAVIALLTGAAARASRSLVPGAR